MDLMTLELNYLLLKNMITLYVFFSVTIILNL